ncbi:RDD family protein [Candidatus Xianfuyuplasma coldseepsis]|uniref:RDD family protein n=1 Tax=Candidatus Xianfuyuplasma coldseepsis TaxID=2782163 RepID=A0A7L7KSA1_9MOLU|nr:RDD family protein [Xianfuyuplasma coldseepsis]QMS85597.1 RDD family protein [Xianfuyuplasma coldseepsis]
MDKEQLILEIKACQPSYGSLVLSRLIDFILLVVLIIIAYFISYPDGDLFNSSSYLLFVALNVLSLFIVFVLPILILKGQTIGEKIIGIKFYSLITFEVIGRERFMNLLGAAVATNLIHNDAYESLHDLINPMQTLRMKRLGYIYINMKLFQELLKNVPDMPKIINPDFGKTIEEINAEIEEYFNNIE